MSRKGLGKGRSSRTVSNKKRKLKNYYRKLFKKSKEQKERNEKAGYKNPKKKYFCDKYPTEKSFMDKIKIKGASPTSASSRSIL